MATLKNWQSSYPGAQQMNLESFSSLGYGAAMASILAGWNQVKNVFSRLAGILVITVKFQEGNSHTAARSYCVKRLRSRPPGMRQYFALVQYIRPSSRHAFVMYEDLGAEGRIFWRDKVPLWVGPVKNQGSSASAGMTFRFIRGTLDPDELALDIASMKEPLNNDNGVIDRFKIVRIAGRSSKNTQRGNGDDVQKSSGGAPQATIGGDMSSINGRLVGWASTDIGEPVVSKDPLARMALTSEVGSVIQRVQRWYDSKEWYASKEIPWRFGLLFHGKPGTGKSSLTKALAQKLNIPIVVLDISTMDNQEFHAGYQQALGMTPCVVLLEDIDAVFEGRENIAAEKGQGLTFDCLLNTTSGVEASDGVLLVVTTNNLDKVDPALGQPQPGSQATRPGRIDRVVELPILDAAGRHKIATRILEGCHWSWIPHVEEAGVGDTGAQFEDRCATLALNLYWSDDPMARAA